MSQNRLRHAKRFVFMQKSRARMTQSVPAHFREFETFASGMNKPLENILSTKRGTFSTDKHQITRIRILRAKIFEHVAQKFAHRDIANAAARFWCAKMTLVHGFA